ncbi:MAG: ATP-binding protein [candidate division Zixibacteria bacterium]|nr:ATP-binding protein [candidate division Zixibacteria bacterium]
MDDTSKVASESLTEAEKISKFTESYASFSRIVNSLQRKYIELKDEFSAQNEQLVDANRKLIDLGKRNLAATQFLNGILDSIAVGVIAIDQNGRITHFNPAASVILSIPQDEPAGKAYREMIPPGTPIDANALRTYETGREVDARKRTIELADGSRLNLSVSTAILRDDDGRPTGAVEILHDLTKIEKMEQEIVRLNTLAALGEMAATIAHEVRNPLSGISGFAALLERDLDEGDPRRDLVKKITRGVNSLNETVATLLSYTRFEELNKRETAYGDFLQAVIDQFTIDGADRMADTGIILTPPGDEESLKAFPVIDQMLFRQIFFNMFSNAIEACGSGARIEVAYRKLARQEATTKYGDMLLLGLDETVIETTIVDNGPGIPEEHREKIFAPFFTTKAGGNGLGLAVAVKIIKAHGGEIIAEAAPEGGSMFRLLIPIKM